MSSKQQAFATSSFISTNRVRIPGLNFQFNPRQQQLAFAYAEQAQPEVRQALARVHRLTDAERAELWQALTVAFERVKQEVQ
jgi:hypothetical protein